MSEQYKPYFILFRAFKGDKIIQNKFFFSCLSDLNGFLEHFERNKSPKFKYNIAVFEMNLMTRMDENGRYLHD